MAISLIKQGFNPLSFSDDTCTISIRGLARLLEIDKTTIQSHFKGGGKKPSKLAIIFTECGFEVGGNYTKI